MSRTKNVSREKYVNFIDKSEQFYDSMKDAVDRGNNDAAVAAAVHCAICYVDALTVLRLGKKSSAQNHIEAAILLKETKTSDESEKSRVCVKLMELLELKTPAEYDDRKLSKAESESAVNSLEKIRKFIKTEIEKSQIV
ncbi:HEPN domain-containing protein [Candidatus Micrarchaeota archaeon]|nr:HEPN domain-containing protein [Candidatus Micrarchaeota archaeon]